MTASHRRWHLRLWLVLVPVVVLILLRGLLP